MSRPRAVAVIPARGGSKGVPGKNVARVGGRPLIARAVTSALAAVNDVYVSTDDDVIAEAARAAGAEIIVRPAELAGDFASSESALEHACDEIERRLGGAPDVLAFLQATSPFIDGPALARAVQRVADGEVDSIMSVVETYEFLWRAGTDGAVGINHDAAYRPRRQDREPDYRETGAFYAMSWSGFREHHHRFFGRIGLQEVPAATSLEIDDLGELELAQLLAAGVDTTPESLDGIQWLVTDFDGVHTDDRALVSEDGVESVLVSRSDGLGLEMLRKHGLPLLILSKERNPVVAARARKVHADVIQAVDDKSSALMKWARDNEVDLSQVAYVGNDVNDVEAMRLVGWPIAVADAHPAVLRHARLVLNRTGGRGALRELAELILTPNKQRDLHV